MKTATDYNPITNDLSWSRAGQALLVCRQTTIARSGSRILLRTEKWQI